MAFSILDTILKRKAYACVVGVLLRLGFVTYGTLHDQIFEVKYTDIDYVVFTDAAKFVHEGSQPYQRETYRYSPLLAWMMLPNISLHPSFGKYLFSVFDIVTGFMMCNMLEKGGSRQKDSVASRFHPVSFMSVLWLWNPFVITISTRGSAEAIQSFLVVATLYFLLEQRVILAALFFGFAVHFKIYPVVFSISILAYLLTTFGENITKFQRRDYSPLKRLGAVLCIKEVPIFFATSAATFFAITALMYKWYGVTFIQETYLYHFSRTDVKHNFSPYFYIMHILSPSSLEKVLGILAFVPQAVSVTWLGLKYHRNLPLAWFLQIFAFVSFNKVCTSQYFIWYLSLLPLALGYMNIQWHAGVSILLFWCGAQALWLFMAYLFEFQGLNVLFLVWIASLIFLAVNVWILVSLARYVVKDIEDTKGKKD